MKVKEGSRNPQNCKLLSVTKAQEVGGGKPREAPAGPSLQGKAHLIIGFAVGQWGEFDVF